MNHRVRRAATLFITLALIAGCKGRNSKAPKYRTEAVDRGNITMTVTATGTLSAVTTVQVGSQVSGVIARLYADFNSKVTKGQLLAELDPTSLQAQVEQRRADMTRAQVDAANTKISFERQRQLQQAGLAAQSDYDAAKAQWQMANAQVQQSAAALRQAETNLKYTKIVSPIDGIVVDRQYDVGQTVAASFQAPTLFAIAQDLTKMQVQADVDQSDIGRVKIGQPVRFSVDAYPDEEFRGRIAQIRLNAQVNQNVVSYPVIIEVPNPGERLRPKMTANVTIEVDQVRDVLRVPNGALRFKPETTSESGGGGQRASAERTSSGGGGQNTERAAWQMGERQRGVGGAAGAFGGKREKKMQTVYILTPEQKLKPVQIRTGISDGRFTQVVEGELHEGDKVVTGLATTKVEGPAAFGGGMGGGGQRGGGGGGRGPR